MTAQLRGGKVNQDTGELQEVPIEEAMIKFCTEEWWKLSFTLSDGTRMRLVKQDDFTIWPTFSNDSTGGGFEFGFPNKKD